MHPLLVLMAPVFMDCARFLDHGSPFWLRAKQGRFTPVSVRITLARFRHMQTGWACGKNKSLWGIEALFLAKTVDI